METPRTFRIDRGIGQYDFNDYYAVLGLPVTAEASQVRKRYILIAKSLHPDVHGRTSSEKLIATQYLSKLVNPAYNVLSQERERTEYAAILKLLGKRLMKRNQKFTPQSELAQKYLQSRDIDYERIIHEIAKIQYQDLDKALEHIGLLSELNLVHILLQEGYQHFTDDLKGTTTIAAPNQAMNYGQPRSQSTSQVNGQANGQTAGQRSGAGGMNSYNDKTGGMASTGGGYQMRSEANAARQASNNTSGLNSANNSDTTIGNTSGTAKVNPAANTNNASGSINQYIRQAENYIAQQLWASALKELRTAIQIDCNNSKCHALLGFVYMNQKLTGMAKVSFQQALKLNPQEPMALQYIAQVNGTSNSKLQDKSKDNKKGGFFGWLGGG